MTDTPQEIADECFDIYLTEMGIVMKERRLIISYAQSLLSAKLKEQRKICADKGEEWWKIANRSVGGSMGKYPNALKHDIVTAPEPKI